MPYKSIFTGLLSLVFVIDFINTAGLTSQEIAKFQVTGNYEASVSVDSSNSEYYVISASGIPDHAWEEVNPNTPSNQNYNIKIPKTPTVATTKACVPFGKIGLTRTGVAIYNPLAAGSVNAVEGDSAETFDSCDGHASPDGAYHYHKIPNSCLYNNTVDELIGVAFDGFPIYGPNVSDISDRWINSTDLDSCHGREVSGGYRYHVTEQWPYFLGCYHGTVYDDVVTVTYDCDLSSNDWNQWLYYLCECPEGTGTGTTNTDCHPPPPPGQQCPSSISNVNSNYNSNASLLSPLTSFYSIVLLLSAIILEYM